MIKHIGISYGVKDFAKYIDKYACDSDFLRDKTINNVSCISSLFRMYKRDVFNLVSGMNEEITYDDVNEVDFSLRVRNMGLVNIFCPNAVVLDYAEDKEIEKSSKHSEEIENLKTTWKVFFDKYDPYYNINFNPIEQRTILRVDEVKY